jgi:glycine cleavage system H protein
MFFMKGLLIHDHIWKIAIEKITRLFQDGWMRYYSSDHLWIEIGSGVARIGITDFGLEQHGEIVYLELPTMGDELCAGGEVAVIESVKAASDVYSPVPGKIRAVNNTLSSSLQALNTDPENSGWLYEVDLPDCFDSQDLLEKQAYLLSIRKA